MQNLKNNFSVLILSYNEEIDIKDCIKSVSVSDDIVVLDSFSTDKTKQYTTNLNIRFFERKFDDYSNQRNYGLHNIQFKNKYVLLLDADERATLALNTELLEICNSNDKQLTPVYLVRRKVVLDNKILKWNLSSSIWVERFVIPTEVKFFGSVHEKLIFEGNYSFLKEHLIHHQFSKGINNWIERRKKYALMQQYNILIHNDTNTPSCSILNKRIKFKRKIFDKLPFSHLLYFIYNFFFKFTFLDGYVGLKYISLESYSLYLTAKYKKNAKQPLSAQVFTNFN